MPQDDPFKEFGGKAVSKAAPAKTTEADPFAEFGGQEVKKKASGSGVKNTSEQSVTGSKPTQTSQANTTKPKTPPPSRNQNFRFYGESEYPTTAPVLTEYDKMSRRVQAEKEADEKLTSGLGLQVKAKPGIGTSLTSGSGGLKKDFTRKITGAGTAIEMQYNEKLKEAREAYTQEKGESVMKEVDTAIANRGKEIVKTDTENVGSRPGYMYNKFLGGIGQLINGLAEVGLNAASTNPLNYATINDVTMRAYKKEIAPRVRESFRNMFGTSADLGSQAQYDSETITSAIGGVFNSMPAMATGYTGLLLQGIDGASQSIEAQDPEGKLDGATKMIYSYGVGLVAAQLENWGLQKIASGNTTILSNIIFGKAMREAQAKAGGKVGGDMLMKYIEANTKGVAQAFAKGGARAVEGFLGEAITGGSQEAVTIGAEDLLNRATGESIFDTAKESTWDGFIKRVAYAGLQEGIGGVFMAGGGSAIKSIYNGARKKIVDNRNAKIQALNDQLDNPNLSPSAVELLTKSKIQEQEALQTTVKDESLVQQALSPEQLKRAAELSDDLQKAEEALKDPSLTEDMKKVIEEQVKALSTELDEVSTPDPVALKQIQEVDAMITKFQDENPDVVVDPLDDMPVIATTTMDRIEDGKPTDPIALEETSDYLYLKYKELSDMKRDRNRRLTMEQIESMQEVLSNAIETVENYKTQLDEEANAEAGKTEVQPEKPVVAESVETESPASPEEVITAAEEVTELPDVELQDEGKTAPELPATAPTKEVTAPVVTKLADLPQKDGKWTLNDAPIIDASEVDLDGSGYDTEGMDIQRVKVLEIRGRNADGKLTGTVRVIGKVDGKGVADTLEVFFKEDGTAEAETTTDLPDVDLAGDFLNDLESFKVKEEPKPKKTIEKKKPEPVTKPVETVTEKPESVTELPEVDLEDEVDTKSAWEKNIESLINPETGMGATLRKITAEAKPYRDAFMKRLKITMDDFNGFSDKGKAKIQEQWVNSPEFKELSNLDQTNENESQPEPDTKTVIAQAETTIAEVAVVEPESKEVTPAIEAIDEAIADIDNELSLLGYYDTSNSTAKDDHETGNKAPERKFKKDLEKYSKALATALGFEHDTDKKGKKIYANTNVAPAGGDGRITLWKPGSEYGVTLSFQANRDYSGQEDSDNIELGENLMWRVVKRGGKYDGSNNWYQSKAKVSKLAAQIKPSVDNWSRNEIPVIKSEATTPKITEIAKADPRIMVVKPKPAVDNEAIVKENERLWGERNKRLEPISKKFESDEIDFKTFSDQINKSDAQFAKENPDYYTFENNRLLNSDKVIQSAKTVYGEKSEKLLTNLRGGFDQLLNPKTPAAKPAETPVAKTDNIAELHKKELADAKKAFMATFGQFNSGVNPETISAGMKLMGVYFKIGTYKFGDIVKDMKADYGDAINNIFEGLKSAYGAYMAQQATDAEIELMTDFTELRKATLDNILTEKENDTNSQSDQLEVDSPATPGRQQSGTTEGTSPDTAPKRLPGQKDDSGSESGTDVSGETTGTEDPASGKPGTGNGSGTKRGNSGTTAKADTGESASVDQKKREVKPEDRNHVIAKADVVVPSGAVGKFNGNVDAFLLLQKLEKENRNPSPAEKKVLAQFVGWGGLASYLNNTNGNYNATEVIPALIKGTGHRFYGMNAMGSYGYQTIPESEGMDLSQFTSTDDIISQLQKRAAEFGFTFSPDDIRKPFLEAILSKEDYQAATNSTINAHYTDRRVIDKLWNVAERLGFKGGRVLEPSAGIGHFFGLMPKTLQDKTMLQGYELDTVTGKLLQKLYPQANITVGGFEHSRVKPNSVDLAISNVPFAKDAPYDKAYPELSKFSMHNYFIAKNLKLLKPGGLAIMITSSSTMDNHASSKFREWSVDPNGGNSVLVGAIRLPNNAFKENAGTEVTTDILIFKKRSDADTSALENDFRYTKLLKAGKDREGNTVEININEYFLKHPENMLGEMMTAHEAGSGGLHGSGNATLKAEKGLDIEKEIQRVIDTFPENIQDTHQTKGVKEDVEEDIIALDKKEGSIFERGGKIYQVNDGSGVHLPMKDNQVAMAKAYLGLKLDLFGLIREEQKVDSDETTIETLRDELNKKYDAFLKKFGNINGRTASFMEEVDIDYPILTTLEDIKRQVVADKNGKEKVIQVISKGEILSKRVNFPRQEPETADNHTDAIDISLNYRNRIDLEYISKLMGQSVDEAKAEILAQELAFENPENGLLETPEEYLSGPVRDKLERVQELLENDPSLERNVKALTKVIPQDIPSGLIQYTLGAGWVPPAVYQDFAREVLGLDTEIRYLEKAGKFSMTVKGGEYNAKNTSTYAIPAKPLDGSLGKKGHELFGASLNTKSVELWKAVDKGDKKVKVKDAEGTAAAQAIQKQLQDEFVAWIRTKEDHAASTEKIYNRLFRNIAERNQRTPDFDYYPGASKAIKLYLHQKRAISRGLTGSTLFAHEVGSGKTFTIITLAMEKRRLGLAKKPMVIVQNATLKAFVRDWKILYPGAKILAPSDKELKSAGRKRLFAKIATGDWDAVILPQSQISMIPDDPEREKAYIQEQIEEMKYTLSQMDKKNEHHSMRQLEKEIETLEDKVLQLGMEPEQEYDEDGNELPMKKKTGGKSKAKTIGEKALLIEAGIRKILNRKTDKLFNFEELGVDALLIDEAHAYKKLGFQTSMQKIKGIDTGKSQRSQSIKLKSQYIMEKTGGKNVHFFTGTPISNTMAEAWTMMKYLNPNLLAKMGIQYFDQFANTFGQAVPSLEQSGGGTFKVVQRFAKFQNMSEFLLAFRSITDVVLSEDVAEFQNSDLIPKLKGGAFTQVILKQTPALKQQIKQFRRTLEAFEKMSGKEKQMNRHIPLVVFGQAKKSAIDMRLLKPGAVDDPGSKLNMAVRNVFDKYHETTDVQGTQMLFCDLYQSPEAKNQFLDEDGLIENPFYKKREFNLFEDIKAKLVAQGIPADEIAILSDKKYDNRDKKLALFDKMNEGKVRIALGTTERMGVGVNAQQKMVALHHVDAPGRPMDFTQRNGRIIRQGNENKEIEVFTYGVENTLDSSAFQRLGTKQKFVNQLMKGKIDITDRITEDPADETEMAFDEMMAHLSDSPYATKKLLVDNALRTEKQKKDMFMAKKIDATTRARANASYLAEDIKSRDEAQGYENVAKKHFPDQEITEVEVEGKVYTEKWNDAIDAFISKVGKQVAEMDGTETAKRFADFIKFNGVAIPVEIRQSTTINKETHLAEVSYTVDFAAPEIGIGGDSSRSAYLNVPSAKATGLLAMFRSRLSDRFGAVAEWNTYIESRQKNIEQLEKDAQGTFDETKLNDLQKESDELGVLMVADSEKRAAEEKAEEERERDGLPPLEEQDDDMDIDLMPDAEKIQNAKDSFAANIHTAIGDLAKARKLEHIDLAALMAEYRYKQVGDLQDITDLDDAKVAKAFINLEGKGYVENEGLTDNPYYILTERGAELVRAVEARLDTLKNVKEGTDLFPQHANIQPFIDALQKAKIKPGQTFSFIIPIPPAIVNGAIDVMIAAIKAGNTAQQAIRKGAAEIKRRKGTQDMADEFSRVMTERYGVKYAKVNVKTPGSETGIRNASVAEQLESHNLPPIDRRPTTDRSHEALAAEAQRLVENGYDLSEMIGRMRRGDSLSDLEVFINKLYLAGLSKRMDADPTQANLDAYYTHAKLTEAGGSENARSLAARAGTVTKEDNLSNFLIDEKIAHDVSELDPATFLKRVEEYKRDEEVRRKLAEIEAQKREDEIRKKAEAAIKRAQAQAKANKTASTGTSSTSGTTTRKTAGDFQAERQTAFDRIKAKWAKASRGGGIMNSSIIPYAPQLIEIAPDVAVIVKSYVQEGIVNLDEVVRKLHRFLKDEVDTRITESDVLDLIAGEYNEAPKTRTQIQEDVSNLKLQAKLLSQIEELERGNIPVKVTAQKQRNALIEQLKSRVRELEKSLQPDRTAEKAEKAIGRRKAQIQARIDKLRDDLRTGAYLTETPTPRVKAPVDPEVKKLLDEHIAFVKETQMRRQKAAYEARSKWQKSWSLFHEILGVRRLIQVSLDWSIPFRQAVTVTLNPRHIATTGKAFANMAKSTFSPKYYDRMNFAIHTDESYDRMMEAGVHLNETSSLDDRKRNEDFKNSFMYKIPIIREPLLATNRAADAYLNTCRTELFKKMERNLNRAGHTLENNPEAFKGAAKWIMNITGRGTMVKFLEDRMAQEVLGNTFYGARLMASRFNLLNPVYYAKMPKEIRKQVMADVAGYVGTIGLTALAAVASGATVSFDWDEPEFLQVKFGNRTFDLTGGMGQYLRMYFRLMHGMSHAVAYNTGLTDITNKEYKKRGGFTIRSFIKFFQYKLAPNTSYVVSGLHGIDPLYKDFDWREIYELYPMYVEDVREAWAEQGLTGAMLVMVPNFVGIGTRNYKDEKKAENYNRIISPEQQQQIDAMQVQMKKQMDSPAMKRQMEQAKKMVEEMKKRNQ